MDFIENLISAGGEVYKVGGSVRNSLYNNIHNSNILVKDYDILVRMLPLEEIIELLKPHGFVKVVGIRFGVIKFKEKYSEKNCEKNNLKSDAEINELDIAIPRIERSTGTKYKDFEIIADHKIPIEEDFSRRDATINAIGIRIFNKNDLYRTDYSNQNSEDIKNIIDPLNGISDIKQKIWRAVGNPNSRFKEDPTRIMRALRQCAELDLVLDDTTKQYIFSDYTLLEVIMKESIVRITEEIVRLLLGNYVNILPVLYNSGIAKLLQIPHNSLHTLTRHYEILHSYNIRVKLAILLCSHSDKNSESIKWTRKFELSAAPHFSKNDVSFINCVSELAEKFNNFLKTLAKEIIENEKNEENIEKQIRISIRRLIQGCEKISPNRGHIFSKDLIRYNSIIYSDSNFVNLDKLLFICDEEKCIPLNASHIALKGDEIENIWQKINNTNTKIEGKKIKEIKEYLLEIITIGNLMNVNDELSLQVYKYLTS